MERAKGKGWMQELIGVCIGALASSCQELISDPDWEKDWLAMDRDQLHEFLKSSDLSIKSPIAPSFLCLPAAGQGAGEFALWEAVGRWVGSGSHPERRGSYAEKTLAGLVPLIRFPFMSPDELSQLEASPLAQAYAKIFQVKPHCILPVDFRSPHNRGQCSCDCTGQNEGHSE